MTRKTENFRYAIIPAGAITDPRVEPRALQVLCLLGRHANDNGWCRRSQVKMAEELNCGRTTINRAIDLLIETGYVERREEGRGSAKPQPGKQPFASYSYRVRLDRSDKEIQDVIEGGVHERTPEEGVHQRTGGCPSMDTGVSTQTDTRVSTSRTPLIEHTPIEHAPLEQTPRAARDDTAQPNSRNLFGVEETKPTKPSKSANRNIANDDVNAAFDAYDEAAARLGWGACQVRTELRRGSMRKRLQEGGGLQGWYAALEKAEASDFLMGRAPPRDDRPPFKTHIDFLLQQKSFVSLMEGKYDNRTGTNGAGSGGVLASAARVAARRAANGAH